ncbi:hypothetical protein A4X13_0g7290 [Tilletia indica]|uniref:Ubiquitin-like protease family profile domain-containing protein n=1 Tax=Tilletia indica TaxID=43049 RepID=A0A8T8SLQ0_9BASI|nr:hypothetical protein A4X13_0g7290 [Tilletia indica]
MDSLWFTKIQTAWEATPRDDTWFSTKFTKNIDVFERPYLVIPINDTAHWDLILVVNPGFLLNAPMSADKAAASANSTRHSNARSNDTSGRPNKRRRVEVEASSDLQIAPVPSEGPSKSAPILTLPPGTDSSEFMRWLPRRSGPPQKPSKYLFPLEREEEPPPAGVSTSAMRSNHEGSRYRWDRPTIVSMDSTASLAAMHVHVVSEFLRNEAATKKRSELAAAGVVWNDEVKASKSRALGKMVINRISAVVPIQPNGYDCALFMLHNVRRFFSDPEAFMHLIVDDYERRRTPGAATVNQLWADDQAKRARTDWNRELNRMADECSRAGAMKVDSSGGDDEIVFTEATKAT